MPDEFEIFTRAVDARIHRSPAERETGAELYGVLRDHTAADGIGVVLLAVGDRYDVTYDAVIPPEAIALAMSVCGWSAPMDVALAQVQRPSRHPQRCRIHQTIVIDDLDDGGVLRMANAEPLYLTGAAGAIFDLLVECWDRTRPRGVA